ncbi:MAG: discoidin domain-containing protein, partial [Bacteroidetes bacterium]|nr:discoidin domain-containing protein [Bacteroidota bacterium]
MRYSSFVFLCTILSSSVAFTADSINVALFSRVTVQYAVNEPEFLPITNADPMKMVDNNTSTFYNLPVGQEGTTFLFDLGAEHQISTFIARAFASMTNFRLRGYGLEGSTDGEQWTTMAQDANQLLATAVVTLTPTPTRYIRLTVTQLDPTRPNGVATILSEIQLWAPIDRPTIVGVSLSATSGQGIRFQDIQWSSFLMDSTNTVDISYRAAGLGTPEIPIASSVPNTKLYSWETALVPDGSYAIIVRPKPSGMAGSGTGVVANFPNFAAFVIDESTEWSRAISGPWGFSQLLGDTIKLQWKCSPRIPREQSFAISYSMDSARTWIPLTVVADSSARSAKIPMPVGSSTSPTAFFRVGAVVDGIEYAAVRTQRPIVLSLPPEQLTTRWSHAYAYRNGDAQGSSSLRGGFNAYAIDGQAVRILTGGLPYSPTGPLGDPYGSGPAMTVSSAVADMDGDGLKEVSPGGSIARDDGSRYSVPSVQFPIMSGGVLMADVAGDHKLELILTLRGSIEVRNDTFALVNRVVFPTPAYAGVQSCAGDIDGDGVNEIVYAMQDRLYAIKANGDLIPGFPRQFSENMVGWVVLADLDRTGRPQIVTGTTSHLYCIKG